MNINRKILNLLEKDSKLTAKDIALMLDADIEDIEKRIKKLEDDKTILAYKTVVNWENVDKDTVSALIELKITPQKGEGFDKIAQKILNFHEVRSLHLMSGGFDLAVEIEGSTIKEVAMFVAQKLATLESVVSTATHFVLKHYKVDGVVFEDNDKDERGVITL